MLTNNEEHKTELITVTWDGEELSLSSRLLNDEESVKKSTRKRLKLEANLLESGCNS